MNTAKIATIYSPYVAQLLSTATPEARHELLLILSMKREDNALVSRWEVRVRNFDPKTVDFDQRCSQRVHAWAIKQFPETDHKQPAGEAWSAMAADFSNKLAADFLLRFSSKEDFATLLRGIQHYQRKLNRQSKRLLAQLRTYHGAQVLAARELATQLSEPELSCMRLPIEEYCHRVDAAEQQEEQTRQKYNKPEGKYGREIMWHKSFPAEFVASLSGMPLYEIGSFLGNNLSGDCKGGVPLDIADYAYMADVLREGLASSRTPLATLRLERALACVEEAGARLAPAAQPIYATTQPTAQDVVTLARIAQVAATL